jgi:hypothetical protein
MAEAPRVFLSYASEDKYWVNAFQTSLAFQGIGVVRVLDYAAEDVGFGDLAARLDERIEGSAVVIAFVSADYRNKQWTIAEWEGALSEAQRRRLVFVPIMLDADAMAWWKDQRQRGKLTALSRTFAYVNFTDAGGRRLEIRPEDTQVNGMIARLARQIKQELAIRPVPERPSTPPRPQPFCEAPDVIVPGHPAAALPQQIAAHVPTENQWAAEIKKVAVARPAASKIIRSEHFEASAESAHAENFLRYRVYNSGQPLSFSDVFDLWERDVKFIDFYISIFKQCGYIGFAWETPAVSTASVHRDFEFVIHSLPKASRRPDRKTYSEYFDTKNAPEGIVSFKNLGGDALLIVPSPYRKGADYSGMAEFFREAPISQQRGLWRELGRHAKSRLSDQPMWLSVASGGIQWLHIRIDSTPKYYRYGPYS